jgi:hypothetical protein
MRSTARLRVVDAMLIPREGREQRSSGNTAASANGLPCGEGDKQAERRKERIHGEAGSTERS